MNLDDFHYELPPELIAQHPTDERSDARLLTFDPASDAFVDRTMNDFVSFIAPGDLVVFNNTRVIPARLFGTRETGGKVELLVERILPGQEILVHLRSSKTPRAGSGIHIAGEFDFTVLGRESGYYRLRNNSATDIQDIMSQVGHTPLPPYIERADEPRDDVRYQTVYARFPGAVAAPTAGLHFDESTMADIVAAGARVEFVTLHVGAGTFQPVRTARIEEHTMHSEWFEVSAGVCDAVEQTRAAGGRVIAIGTTSVRALESAYSDGGLHPHAGETDIFIYPGYDFRVVDALLTNFHLPGSTLLMLVSAFAGREHILRAYEHAVERRYRFFSYGDAMWLTRTSKHAG